MAQGVNLADRIREDFSIKDQDPNLYSPLNLAFIGDSIFDLIVKTVIVGTANRPVNVQQRKASSFVKASSQAAMADALIPEFTEEELGIFRRGKNSKPYTKAKNTDYSTYLKATGFEAVMGYLYLGGREERLLELVKRGIEAIESASAQK